MGKFMITNNNKSPSLRVFEGHDGAIVLFETGDFPLANAAIAAQGAASAPRAYVVLKGKGEKNNCNVTILEGGE